MTSRLFAAAVLVACLFPRFASSAPATPPAEAAAQIEKSLADEVYKGSTGKLAPLVNDEVFLRRVSLDLIGEMPTPEEVTVFVLDPAKDKRTRLVEKLLADSRFGENWGRYWRDVIFYRRTEDRALVTAPAFTDWCAAELNKNTTWDKIATQLITATGSIYDEGRTALINAQQARPEETTAEVARIFLGIQIQCAQCHDHPTDRWKREQFHELTAFFPRIALRPTEPMDQRSFQVMSDDSPARFRPRNNDNRFRGEPEHFMPDLKDPNSRGKQMTPVFFATGQSLPLGKTDQDRRGTLAAWITAKENPWFAKAYVNRVWAELVGEGFYEPIDDLGPDRTCSAPKTLDYLASAFYASGYDTKWLFRTICATQLYQRESRARRNSNETPFLANASQRLRGDQLYTSLLTVLGADESAVNRYRAAGGGGARAFGRDPRFLFNFVFGYDPSVPREEVTSSIPQALAMMNSPNLNSGINAKNTSYGLGKLLTQIKDDKALTIELYLRVLAREPNEKELATCLLHVKQVNNRNEAFEDITWALVNSAEFLHRR